MGGIIGAIVLLVLAGLSLYREGRVFRFLGSLPFGLSALGMFGVLCVVRGLYGFPLTPFFAVVWLALMLSLGCVVVRVVCASGLRRWGFLANHLGLWLVFFGAGVGTLDYVELNIRVQEGETIGMPFSMRLDDFRMEVYPDTGMPSYFGSAVTVDGRPFVVEVNRPLRHRGWAVYQAGYDRAAGPESGYSVFQMVRDPWLPVVYAGIFLLAVGAVIGVTGSGRRQRG